jgi:hypothetical protein
MRVCAPSTDHAPPNNGRRSPRISSDTIHDLEPNSPLQPPSLPDADYQLGLESDYPGPDNACRRLGDAPASVPVRLRNEVPTLRIRHLLALPVIASLAACTSVSPASNAPSPAATARPAQPTRSAGAAASPAPAAAAAAKTASPAASPRTSPQPSPSPAAQLSTTLREANTAFSRQDYSTALRLYRRAAADESATRASSTADASAARSLRAFARFRLMLTDIVVGQEEDARTTLDEMRAQDDGTQFLRIALAFWDTYGMTADLQSACRQVTQFIKENPAALQPLNSPSPGLQMTAENVCQVPGR